MELKFYIKNIEICLGLVDLLAARGQDHQLKAVIQCETLLTNQLSTNYINFQQYSDHQTKKEQYTTPTKLYISLCLHPKTHDPDPVRK